MTSDNSHPSGLPHHMRIAALQCNFEKGDVSTLAVPEKWAAMGFNVEQLFHTHSEMYSAVFEEQKHGTMLKTYLSECSDNGGKVILYMNCHILLDSQADKASEWAQVNSDGSYLQSYGTYYGCCLNSDWVDYFLESIAGLKGYAIAGIFFDGPSASPCYCPRCAETFESNTTIPLAEATERQIDEFTLQSRINFIRAAYNKVKEVNPNWISYYNTGLMHMNATTSQVAEILAHNDLIGTEGGFQFYGNAARIDIWRAGQHARLVESVAGDKPRIIFMAGDHKPWSWYLHTSAETKLCYGSILANGASTWYGIHSDMATLKSDAGTAAAEMAQFDKRCDPLYQSSISCADVAIFFSFDTSKNYTSSGEETDLYQSKDKKTNVGIGNFMDSFQGAYGALFRSNIPCDIVNELTLERLSDYSVILLPTIACMSKATAVALKEFVLTGGTLIADSDTALFDEHGKRCDDYQLASLFGISFKQYKHYQQHDYFGMNKHWDIFKAAGIRHLPSPLTNIELSVTDKTEVLARLYPPIPGRYAGRPSRKKMPFITHKKNGKGHAYYIAGTFFELYRNHNIEHYRQIIEHLTTMHSEPVVELIGAPQSVEFTVRKSLSADNALMVHLVNYSGGMTRPISSVIPVNNLRLRINRAFSKVTAAFTNQELTMNKDGSVTLPELREFEAIVIE